MNLYICNSDILNCLHFPDVETTWAIIKSIIYEAMTLFIPKFQFHSKQYIQSGLLRICVTNYIQCISLNKPTNVFLLIVMQHV